MTPQSPVAETDAIILCGGRGTRLGDVTAKTPKPLLPVGESPFLLRRLLALRDEGVRRIILSTHVFAEQFDAFQREYADLFPELTIIREPEPLGTGGALRFAASAVRSPLCVAMNGDSWVEQPLAPLLTAHLARGRAFTMTVIRADRVEGDTRQKGLVMLGPHQEILGFSTGTATSGWINAGLYVINTALLTQWPRDSYDVERRFLALVPSSERYAFRSDGRLVDIGTPDVYARGETVLASLPDVTRRP